MTAASDFSAALAQSLAAAPAGGTGATDAPAGKGGANAAGDESSPVPAKHSAPDPVATALALLEQALAGVLVGMPSAPAAASAPQLATGAASSGDNGAIGADQGTAATLTALLAQNLSDSKAGMTGAAPVNGSSTPAPAATASTAAAALTAATQLAAGSHVGAQPAAAAAPTLSLSSPVGTSAWTDELGARLTWMAHQGIDSASLQLSPEHLGPLQVSISVHDGRASVWFGAAQPDTRTALQQSLPQLRQLFASQGLTLADAGVSREPPRGQGRQQSARGAAPIAAAAAVGVEATAARAPLAGGLGLVDTYA